MITLAALNSPIVTNVTLPYGDDAFTYIDRADPNGQLIGASSNDENVLMIDPFHLNRSDQ